MSAPAGEERERFGGWRLDALIAAGGLGEVWRAEREGVTAALKRLHTHLARIPEARELFDTEQRLATELPRHPGVVRALEVGDVDGRPYLVMELAAGVDLRRVVAVPAPLDAPEPPPARLPRARVLAIVGGACDAAAHLHAHGWIHGDLSPSNLIVDDADRVVLVDLGVARRAGAGGPVRGSHAYMAPEQVRGHAWTPATDVFALGVILWELAAGARLFHRGPPWLSQAAVIEAEPPPLSDAALDAIAQAALAKDPARRIASAAELAARLREL
ncbi:MAG TPA: serine/threonine-protein kinase [Kofleriaceae bacterium]|nr:serine/threonine-protein kinase [Kofleriaceae bacterium]